MGDPSKVEDFSDVRRGPLADALRRNRLPAFATLGPTDDGGNSAAGGEVDPVKGDAFLARWIPRITASRAYRGGRTAIFITWDEPDDFGGRPQAPIPTIVVAPSVRPGRRVAARLDHYAMLRTTEDLLRLRGHLGAAAHAPSMRRGFRFYDAPTRVGRVPPRSSAPMKLAIRRRPVQGALIVVSVLALAAGVSVAAGVGGGNVIQGCYGKSNGRLRVVTAAGDCKNDELAISWNRRGPAGPAGPPGVPGPPGPRGPVRTLGQVVVPLGSAKVLFASGPFTVTARCRTNVGSPTASRSTSPT